MNVTLLNNRYQILQTLARGGFGETYIAIDTHMPSSRKCVIKKLHPALQSEGIPDWLKERFHREAAILEELGENNRQIPRLYAYFYENDDFYLVQEWIEGVTLTQKQTQQGNVSEAEVREILLKLLPVLQYIHDRQIIHRDIKPDNIILRNSDNLPILIDFGVMKEAVATVLDPYRKTAYSIALGTPGYMAPEQAAGRPVYSSDLYSLGLTAVFLLTGKTPQYLDTDSQTGEILWRKELPELHSHLAAVIDRSIRFHPRDRFSTAREMESQLQSQHIETSFMPTIAVIPPEKPAVRVGVEPEKTIAALPTAAPTVKKNLNLWSWLLYLLLFSGVTVGAFALGFYTFSPKSSPKRNITPPQTFPSPSEPQTFPTPENQNPQIEESPKPVYRPRRRVVPPPSVQPSPVPEASPSPSPSPSPVPTPEVTPTPVPETTPIPEPSPTEIPVTPPEASPAPPPAEVIPTPTPVPSTNPLPPEGKIEPTPPLTPPQ